MAADPTSTLRAAHVRIRDVGSDPQFAPVVAELFREYERELGIDLCFQDFEAEVASLPGAYSTPAGCLLLASVAEQVLGCVGLRPREPGTAELKRLYVRPHGRGRGVARMLARGALAHARAQHYERVVLDTLPTMAAAQALYASLGFRDTGPYTHNPVAGTRFMALDLAV